MSKLSILEQLGFSKTPEIETKQSSYNSQEIIAQLFPVRDSQTLTEIVTMQNSNEENQSSPRNTETIEWVTSNDQTQETVSLFGGQLVVPRS